MPFRDAPPPDFAASRAALHRLAVYVVSPAREAVTGRIGLRALDVSFGTPRFGDDETVVAVEGCDLVRRVGAAESRQPISTLRAAAQWLGVEIDATRSERFDVPAVGDVDEPLAIDAGASRWVAGWYDFAADVLDALRGGATAAENASETQIWPEHFDIAMTVGDEKAGARANYGASPGDASIAPPYLYVGPWSYDGLDDPFFPSGRFAHVTVEELLAAPDPRAAALAFLRRGRDVLRARSSPR